MPRHAIAALCILAAIATDAAADWKPAGRTPVATNTAQPPNVSVRPVAWRDAYDATVRIQCRNGWGSGAVFAVDNQWVWILTNAHVVDAPTCKVEFFRAGHKSTQLHGSLGARLKQGNIDAAVVRVPARHFNGQPPQPLPIGRDPQPGESITTVGCPLADWPALWHGHVTAANGQIVRFRPGSHMVGDFDQMSGRSGSVLCDADGTEIRGLIAWADRASREGMAQPISAVMHALAQTAARHEAQAAQCPPWGCNPRGGGTQPQPPDAGPLFPTLPPEGGGAWSGPAAGAAPRTAGADPRIAELEHRIATLEAERSQLVALWPAIKGMESFYAEAKAQWPKIRSLAEGNPELERLAAKVEVLDSQIQANVDSLAKDFKAELERTQAKTAFDVGSIRDALTERVDRLKDQVVSRETIIDLVRDVAGQKLIHPEASMVEILKTVATDRKDAALELIREELRDLKASAVERAPEAADALAIKYLPPWAALIVSTAIGAWAFVRRAKT